MFPARPTPAEMPPQIGRFTVLGMVGRGGMGVVYTAYDPELDRKVALKLVHLHGAREHLEQARARLLHEAQTMARLSHPNVVTVYEVGTVDAQVFLAMEYVRGESLRDWLRTPRSWRAVLAVFLQAGAGLAAAHRAGIVHRDFKPDNVLVDGDGRVRVVDFGLAAVRGDEVERNPSATLTNTGSGTLAEQSLENSINQNLVAGLHALSPGTLSSMHRTGGRLIGTPAYMAPEQHLGAPADAQADQFSYCVALYEGLYGERPFAGATIGELRTNLVAGKIHSPPPRSPVPLWLRRVLVRGLARAPGDRHPSMEALLLALSRDPMVALRRRLFVAGLGLALLAALAAGYASRRLQEDQETAARVVVQARCDAYAAQVDATWDEPRRAAVIAALHATKLPYATDTWQRIDARVGAHVAKWREVASEVCLDAELHGRTNSAAYAARSACLQHQLAELDALTNTFAGADAKVVERAVHASVALQDPGDCRELTERAQHGTDANHPDVVELRERLARALPQAATGRHAAARAEADEIAAAAVALGAHGLAAEALGRRGAWEEFTGDFKAAEATLTEAFLLAETAGLDPLRAELALSLAGVVGHRLVRVSDGMMWLRQAQAIEDRLGLGGALRVKLLNTEGALRRVLGEVERVSELAAETLSLLEQLYGPEDVRVGPAQLNLGTNFFDRGDYPQAEFHYRKALEILESALGKNHPDLAGALNNLASACEKQGRFAAAEAAYSRSIEIREASFGNHHPGVGISLTNLGELHARQHQHAQAEQRFRQALAIFEVALGPEHPNLASPLGGLGRALVAQGRLEEARPLHLRALERLTAAFGPDHVLVAYPHTDLAALELAAKQPHAAVAPAQRAYMLRQSAKPEEQAEAALVLSKALWHEGSDKPRAVTLAVAAEVQYQAAGPGFASEHAAAVAWRTSIDKSNNLRRE